MSARPASSPAALARSWTTRSSSRASSRLVGPDVCTRQRRRRASGRAWGRGDRPPARIASRSVARPAPASIRESSWAVVASAQMYRSGSSASPSSPRASSARSRASCMRPEGAPGRSASTSRRRTRLPGRRPHSATAARPSVMPSSGPTCSWLPTNIRARAWPGPGGDRASSAACRKSSRARAPRFPVCSWHSPAVIRRSPCASTSSQGVRAAAFSPSSAAAPGAPRRDACAHAASSASATGAEHPTVAAASRARCSGSSTIAASLAWISRRRRGVTDASAAAARSGWLNLVSVPFSSRTPASKAGSREALPARPLRGRPRSWDLPARRPSRGPGAMPWGAPRAGRRRAAGSAEGRVPRPRSSTGATGLGRPRELQGDEGVAAGHPLDAPERGSRQAVPELVGDDRRQRLEPRGPSEHPPLVVGDRRARTRAQRRERPQGCRVQSARDGA